VRVFHTQKLDDILGRIELSDWRQRLREPLTVSEHMLSDNWKSCALGERMKKEGRDLDRVKDLTPEAVKLGFDFATAVKRRDSSAALEILEQIERLPTIWCNRQIFNKSIFVFLGIFYRLLVQDPRLWHKTRPSF